MSSHGKTSYMTPARYLDAHRDGPGGGGGGGVDHGRRRRGEAERQGGKGAVLHGSSSGRGGDGLLVVLGLGGEEGRGGAGIRGDLHDDCGRTALAAPIEEAGEQRHAVKTRATAKGGRLPNITAQEEHRTHQPGLVHLDHHTLSM